MLTRNRADIERTVANVRDATDWADKLVQKIYANPFVLSPFYKPTPEDIRIQAVYDTAQVFTKGAQELHDLVKTLDAIQARAATPAQRQEVSQVQQSIRAVTEPPGADVATAGRRAEAGDPRHAVNAVTGAPIFGPSVKSVPSSGRYLRCGARDPWAPRRRPEDGDSDGSPAGSSSRVASVGIMFCNARARRRRIRRQEHQ